MLAVYALVLAADSLLGIWHGDTTFGPRVHGTLRLEQSGAHWSAHIAGLTADARVAGDTVTIIFPDSVGEFRGHLVGATSVVGCWVQPRGLISSVRYATPAVLRRTGAHAWAGRVAPLDEHYTLYADIQPGMTAVFRIPERNYLGGAAWARYTVVTDGDSLRFIDSTNKDVRTSGHYDPSHHQLTLTWAGGDAPITITMRRDSANWYPRPRGHPPYHYRVPTPGDDGWVTAPARAVGIDERGLTALVQRIAATDPATDNPPLIQSVLIERHGRLVLDEYFYGFDADRLHDLRSASKTFTSVMFGAAMDHGAPVTVDTKVYPLFPSTGDPDPRKTTITVANLLTHSTGLACDDNDDDSPGNEDRMYNQTAQPDWYRFILDLPVAHPAGETYAYCSGGINIVGGVIHATTGAWLPAFFQERVAAPLGIRRWAMNLMPNGDGYAGGGLYLRPRDLLKLGATYLAGGVWHGHRLVSAGWVNRSTARQITASPESDDGYGWHRYLLHTPTGQAVQEYEASGNGGQLLIVLPDYDLAVVFTAANYQRYRVWREFRNDLVAHVIIPSAR
jgi:CubicO group peptidase (beta-lactamase class C family)